MGLFSKNPSKHEQEDITQHIFWIQSFYKTINDGCGIEVFVDCKNRVLNSLEILISYEKKYNSFFKKPKPSDNKKKIFRELPEIERRFVDYTIVKLEKKLLDYSTDRGKRNNFNKEVDKFMYYAGEFLPSTVDYFNRIINERFSEYMQ